MSRIRIALSAAVVLTAASSLWGATGVFKEFPVSAPSGSPTAISAYYGYVVYADAAANQIVRLNPDGTTVGFPIPTPNANPAGISMDYSGNAWFTEYSANRIGKLSQDGLFTEYPIPTPSSGPLGILATSPEVWFTEFIGNKMGKIGADGKIIEFPIPSSNSGPTSISPAYETFANLVFTERNANRIGFVGFDGSIREFPIPTSGSQPMGIASGPDGYYFAEFAGNKIGRAEYGSIAVTEYPLPSPGSGPRGIGLRPNLPEVWFTEELGNRIGRLSPDGSIAEFPVPSPDSHPTDLSPPLSLDGNLWFIEQSGKRIGRVLENMVVVSGAGASSRWDTRFQLANAQTIPEFFHVGAFPVRYAGPQPGVVPPCASQQIEISLAANGSASDTLGANGCRFFSPLFVSAPESDVVPSVSVRVLNMNQPSQSGDLPGVQLSRIAALDPTTLSFPISAVAGTRATLMISDVSLQDSLVMTLTAYSADGEFLSTASATAPVGGVAILPVLSFLGLSELNGQVRVTKISGTGWMWGTLVTVSPDGAMSTMLGTNP